MGTRVGLIFRFRALVPLNSLRLQNLIAAKPSGSPSVVTAKMVTTLDHISGGRLVLGGGAGGTGFDATVLGGEVLPPAARAIEPGDRAMGRIGLVQTHQREPEAGRVDVGERADRADVFER